MREILKTWFGDDLYRHDWLRYPLPPEKYYVRPGICIHGHFKISRQCGVQGCYPEVDQFITVVREPFAILVARYVNNQSLAVNGVLLGGGRYEEVPEDLNEFLEQEIYRPDYRPNILDFLPRTMTMENYKDIIHRYFIYIGVLEDLQFSVDRIADRLGFSSCAVPPSRVPNRIAEADPRLRDAFIKAHPLEYAIYSHIADNYKKW